jgi:hypothetical protein
MQLRFLGKNSTPGDSPTLYATDRGTYVIQGFTVSDPEILAKVDLSPDETCVEVPAELLAHLANDGLHGPVISWAPPIVHVTDRGTCIVQGKRVTDTEARWQMTIPEFEDCVEVTRAALKALLEEGEIGPDHG